MSGRKNTLPPVKFIDGADMSTDVTSNPVDVQNLDNVALQFAWTSTPTGTFKVQASGDGKTNWVDLTLSGSIAAAGAADVAMIDLNQVPFPFIRLVYTASSGSGTLTAYATAKMV